MRRASTIALFLCLTTANAVAATVGYVQTNLVSNIPGLALNTDTDLVNPWGISFGPATPFWVSDNGAGLSTLYNGFGAKQGLIVTIPPAPGSPAGTMSTPTGTVFNSGSAGGSFMGDRFLFATEDGTIDGWQFGLGTNAAVRVNNSGLSVYKGLAIAGNRIYATDFANGAVNVFDSNYNTVLLGATAFNDPALPSGYSPFGIENIGGFIYVTYAKKGGNDDVPGPGFGFVDKYDTDGNLVQRLITGDPGNPASPLNSPWGMALAPSTFGDLAGLFLVGNFGDGRINAFDPTTGAFVSSLNNSAGNPIVNDGLWAIKFGNAGPHFSSNALYFTAGLHDEADGLFGVLQVAPEPSTAFLFGGALLLIAGLRRRTGR